MFFNFTEEGLKMFKREINDNKNTNRILKNSVKLTKYNFKIRLSFKYILENVRTYNYIKNE